MTIYPFFACTAAVALIFLWIFSFKNASPEKRKAYLLPGLIQAFAACVALIRGNVLPGFIPQEIVTIFCYFFTLYLTFTTAISMGKIGKKKFLVAVWALTAIAFWILAIFG